jgi:hypothetical protein
MRIVCSGLLHFSFEGFLKHEISIAFKESGPQRIQYFNIPDKKKNTDTNSQKEFPARETVLFRVITHINPFPLYSVVMLHL